MKTVPNKIVFSTSEPHILLPKLDYRAFVNALEDRKACMRSLNPPSVQCFCRSIEDTGFPVLALQLGSNTSPDNNYGLATNRPSCDTAHLYDKIFKHRVEQCSTMADCFRIDIDALDNQRCPSDETCASWEHGGTSRSGCIRTEYCDLEAEYRGEETRFQCEQKKAGHWIFFSGKDYL